ncbi:hypothetical protein AAMO2058_000512600 [Amorphochlora amoebiformis]
MTMLSTSLGPGSSYLIETTGTKPYGVVDTPSFVRLNPHRGLPTLTLSNYDFGGAENEATSEIEPPAIWESHTCLRYIANRFLPSLLLSNSDASADDGYLLWRRAGVEMWMDWILANFHDANHNYIDQVARTPPENRDEGLYRRSHESYISLFMTVESHLANINGGREPSSFPSICEGASDLTAADIVLGTELNRWYLCWIALRKDAVFLPVEADFKHLGHFYSSLMHREPFLKAVFAAECEHHGLDPENVRIQAQSTWPCR